jgi:hypothetical protein
MKPAIGKRGRKSQMPRQDEKKKRKTKMKENKRLILNLNMYV